jgi:hypothetical protein
MQLCAYRTAFVCLLSALRFYDLTTQSPFEIWLAVKVYKPAKTVADCFKYRNKIGLDVAIEALRDCWRKKLATSDELWYMLGRCAYQTN